MTAEPLIAKAAGSLRGRIRVPGDKSLSHRALIFGAMAVGESKVTGLLEGEDVLATAAALRALGAEITRDEGGTWHIWGRGVGGFHEPAGALDLGNSGTGARLLMGVAAQQPITCMFIGDASLQSRPMGRVTAPLTSMGAEITAREGGRLPLTLRGPETLMPLKYELPVPSAQVKSAVLLAGLAAPGVTSVIEAAPTRDHTERMLRAFGAKVSVETQDGKTVIALQGQPELTPQAVTVPSDPSSAAFPLVAALISPGSEVTVEGVLMNPTRAGLFETLKDMGADLSVENIREEAGEQVADLTARGGALKGVTVPADRAPSMIDEYPVLAVAAAYADGPTHMLGLDELRVKESDRLAAIAAGLKAIGVEAEEGDADLTVQGTGGNIPGGGPVATHMDHRIAMSFLMAGLAAKGAVKIDDGRMIATSFPGFGDLMNGLGANIARANS